MQNRPGLRARHIDLFAGVVTTVAAGMALVFGTSALGVSAIVLVGGALVIAGRFLLARRTEFEARSAEISALFRGQPVAVSEVARDEGWYGLGVDYESAEVLGALPAGASQRYVRRDIDTELRRWIVERMTVAGCSTVIVDGPAKAGKTRCLVAALADAASETLLLRPASKSALWALASRQPEELELRGSVVIWLDDLEDWLLDQEAPLATRTLEQLDSWPIPVLVAATSGGRGLEHLRLRVAREADHLFTEPLQQFRDGLEITRADSSLIVALKSAPSERERTRLRERYGVSIAEQIEQAGGIGPYLIAGPALLQRLEEAAPVQRAVAIAAVAWRRAGILRPIPRAALQALHGYYVEPPHTGADDITDALAWAMRNVHGSQLLSLGGGIEDAYAPLDYVVRRTEPPACAAFVEALVAEHATPEELGGIGYRLLQAGNRQLAEAAWRRGDERGDGRAASNLGVLLNERGNLEEAKAAFRRGDGRGSGTAASNLGALLHADGDLEGAEAAFVRGEERGDGAAASNLGVLLKERGELKEAEAAWRRGDERGNGSAAANLGLLLKQRGDLENAEAAFRRADDRDHGAAASNLGALLMDRGELEEAEAALRRADDRGNPEAATNLGLLLAKRGELEEAEAAYRRGDDRGSRVSATNLGLLLAERGDLEEAEAAYRRGDDRGDGTAASNLGVLLAERGDLEEAEAAYRRGDDRGSGEAAFNLGLLLLLQDGDRGEAESAFRRGDDRGTRGAASNLGLLLEERGELEEAEAAYRRGDKRGDGGATGNLGALLKDRGALEEAEVVLRRGDERGDGVAAWNLGVLLMERGQSEEANAAFRRAKARSDSP